MALTTLQKLVMAAVLLIILAGVFAQSLRKDFDGEDALEMVVNEQPQQIAKIVVHVTGQVMEPGLYRVNAGARVIDAIAAAGGFSAIADTEAVNLAEVLDDGSQVIVPKKPVTISAPLPAMQPVSAPAASQSAANMRSTQGALPSQFSSQHPVGQHKISINSAQPDELQTLPGIGEELARRICYYRYENHGFARIEDLAKVEGIGPATLQKLLPYITL